MIKTIVCGLIICLCFSCSYKFIQIPAGQANTLSGSNFYKTAYPFTWQQRDSLVLQEVLAGNIPSFLKNFVPVHVQVVDSVTGKTIKAIYYVAPDYLSLGANDDWARVNITPMAAQKIADSFHCFLPTRKIVNDIYKAATVKLEP